LFTKNFNRFFSVTTQPEIETPTTEASTQAPTPEASTQSLTTENPTQAPTELPTSSKNIDDSKMYLNKAKEGKREINYCVKLKSTK